MVCSFLLADLKSVDNQWRTVISAKIPKMAKSAQKHDFRLCQGYTPKNVSGGGQSAFSTQSGTPKGGKCRTFFHESTFAWGVALAQVGGASGGGVSPHSVLTSFSGRSRAARPCCRRFSKKKKVRFSPRWAIRRGETRTFFRDSACTWSGCPGPSQNRFF